MLVFVSRIDFCGGDGGRPAEDSGHGSCFCARKSKEDGEIGGDRGIGGGRDLCNGGTGELLAWSCSFAVVAWIISCAMLRR